MSRFENKFIIGLTGNIAVGKSVVRRMLQHLGAYTIDADGLSHQAMMPGAPAYRPVIEMFGRYVVDPNGQINRAKLGAIAFALPDALMALEHIIHPVVGSAIQTLISRATQQVVVVEAIKLLEGNLAAFCDAVWVVDAPPELQLKRLLEKRTMTDAEARRRIQAQNPQTDKLARADVIIYNGGNVDETWKQVQDAWIRIGRPAPTATPKTPIPAVPAAPAAPERVAATMPAIQPLATPIQPKLESQERPFVGGVRARRGTPTHAEEIAQFITTYTGRDVSRMDIMLGFGQKSYIMAQSESGGLVGLVGWQVENLITTVDELYVAVDAPRGPTVRALVDAIESSAHDLQSEVSFVFLPATGDPSVRQAFVDSGYSALRVEELTSPAWREAAHEQLKDGVTGLYKQLRQDRVTRPI